MTPCSLLCEVNVAMAMMALPLVHLFCIVGLFWLVCGNS